MYNKYKGYMPPRVKLLTNHAITGGILFKEGIEIYNSKKVEGIKKNVL